MPLILSGSVDISGSMTATTIVVSSPGGGGMVSSSAQITELAPLMAYTASLKGAAIVSSSQQVQNYFTFAKTGSANTFYANQTIVGSIIARSGNFTAPNNVIGTLLIQGGKEEGGFGEINSRLDFGSNDPSVGENDGIKSGGRISSVIENANGAHVGMVFSTYQQGRTPDLREEVVITNTGDLKLNNGNLVIGTSGKGIDFSATSNGSGTTTSELLNDYEEGTFTPTIIFGTSGTATYAFQTGFYTKIGRQVTVVIAISFNDNTGSGTVSIGGLPFTSLSTNYCRASGAGQTLGMTGMTDGVQFMLPQNATEIEIRYANAGATTQATEANTSTDTDIYCTLTYFTA
jgi:hypothetical protein